MFSLTTEGTLVAQLNKPTDVAFMGQNMIAVSDYGNSRYTLPSSTLTSPLTTTNTTIHNGFVTPYSNSHMTLPVASPIMSQLPLATTGVNTAHQGDSSNMSGILKRGLSDGDLPPKKVPKTGRHRRKKSTPLPITVLPSAAPPIPTPTSAMPTGVKVTGLPGSVQEQDILEVFGFDVVQQIVVKDQVATPGWPGWGRVAWILYQTPWVASAAVRRFDHTHLLGGAVQVRLCDASAIPHEAKTSPVVNNTLSAAAAAVTLCVNQATTTVPVIDLTGQPDSTSGDPSFTGIITSPNSAEPSLPLNLTTHSGSNTATTTSSALASNILATWQSDTSSTPATFPNTSFLDQLMMSTNDPNITNAGASTSTQSSTSDTERPLKFKILRSKVESDSRDTYKMVPSSSSSPPPQAHSFLTNIPEPDQSVSEASDAQSLINSIQYSTVSAHAPGEEEDADVNSDWTCQNCDMFNLFNEKQCQCGALKPVTNDQHDNATVPQ